MILWELFWNFLVIGAVSFGGGYGMISLVREVVLSHGWLTESEFLSFIAVSESTPGPLAVNMATFIGSSQGGFLGALLAMLPFYLCAGFGLMGGGDWRLAAAAGFVLGVGRVLTGFLFMAAALLLAVVVMRVFPALRQSAAKKQPLVPYFAVAFIPAYFL